MKGLVLVLVDTEAQEETRVLYESKVAPMVVIYGQRVFTYQSGNGKGTHFYARGRALWVPEDPHATTL